MSSEAQEERYQAQQQNLREAQGLEDDGEFEVPEVQVPEVNPEIYKDVEPLLLRGFLALPATLNGQLFLFKSLNHHEFDWLTLQDGGQSPAEGSRQHDLFLAHSVASVDAVNVLKDRDSHVGELVEFFGALPKAARQKVVRHLSELNRRANRAVLLVEPFIMEHQSRLRWMQLKGLDLSTTAVSGFEGSQTLGLNWGQLTWRALNQLEDLRENAEREWENAKFIASAMAGKGLQRVYNADKRRRQEAKREQVERREKVIRLALLNEPIDAPGQHGDIVVARTVGELTDQLERDLKGEKDWHDRVIEEHEERIRQEMQQRSQAVHAARAAHIREFGDRPVIAASNLTGLTRAEVQRRIQERHGEVIESLAAQARHPEHTDPRYADFAQKWLQQPIVGTPPSVMPVRSTPRSRARPFRREG